MEFELNQYDLYDLQIDKDHYLIVDCEPDPEYSPREGLTNSVSWSLYLRSNYGICKDITDDLTESDQEIVEQQVKDFLEGFFND